MPENKQIKSLKKQDGCYSQARCVLVERKCLYFYLNFALRKWNQTRLKLSNESFLISIAMKAMSPPSIYWWHAEKDIFTHGSCIVRSRNMATLWGGLLYGDMLNSFDYQKQKLYPMYPTETNRCPYTDKVSQKTVIDDVLKDGVSAVVILKMILRMVCVNFLNQRFRPQASKHLHVSPGQIKVVVSDNSWLLHINEWYS